MPSVQARRLAALHVVITAFYAEPDAPTGAAEDLEPYLTGEEPIARWCAVTESSDSGYGSITYVMPWFDRLADARERTVEYVRDSIYTEQPVAVVDLDTGRVRRPAWRTLRWGPAEVLEVSAHA